MPRHFRWIPIVVGALSVGACAPAPPAPPDTKADLAAIDSTRTAYAAALNSGDLTKLVSLYTDDAVVMPENQTPITGHAAILAFNQGLATEFTPKMALNATETTVSGDWAFDRGDFTMTLTPKNPGPPGTMEHGKYLVVLQKQTDGTWKIAREIGNANMMMAVPAPVTKMK